MATNWQPAYNGLRINGCEKALANITDKQMNAKASDKDVWLNQVAIWGHGSLVARITKSGERLFYFRYQNAKGERVTFPIGTYSRSGDNGTMTLSEANQRSMHLASLHKSGIKNIREHLAAEEAERIATINAEIALQEKIKADAEAELLISSSRLTFQELYDRWFKAVVSKHKDHGEGIERLFKKDVLPFIGKMYVEDVTRQHVSKLLLTMVDRDAKVIAGRALANIRQCYGYGIGIGLIENDPTSHLKKSAFAGKATIRERVLSEDELIYLLTKALPESKLSAKGKASVKIILSTAVRIGELLKAKYKEIDLQNKIWVIPAENAKNGKEHVIHLSDYAVAAFNELFTYVEHDTWLFTDRTKTTHISVKTLTKQIGDRQTESPLQNRASDTTSLQLTGGKWTPHDLRRTSATLMGSLKVSPHVIEKCLNHMEENRMIRTYQHAALFDERKDAFEKLGEKLAEISSVK